MAARMPAGAGGAASRLAAVPVAIAAEITRAPAVRAPLWRADAGGEPARCGEPPSRQGAAVALRGARGRDALRARLPGRDHVGDDPDSRPARGAARGRGDARGW